MGTRRREAAIVLTTGAIRELEEASLAALIAHELAHIALGHTRRATVVAAITALLVRAAGRLRRRAAQGDLLPRSPSTAQADGRETATLRKLIARLHVLGTPPRHDLAADRFAARLLGDAEGLRALLLRLKEHRGTTGITALVDLGTPFLAPALGRAEEVDLDARIRRLRCIAGEGCSHRTRGLWLQAVIFQSLLARAHPAA